jgi:hypothetical protein
MTRAVCRDVCTPLARCLQLVFPTVCRRQVAVLMLMIALRKPVRPLARQANRKDSAVNITIDQNTPSQQPVRRVSRYHRHTGELEQAMQITGKLTAETPSRLRRWLVSPPPALRLLGCVYPCPELVRLRHATTDGPDWAALPGITGDTRSPVPPRPLLPCPTGEHPARPPRGSCESFDSPACLATNAQSHTPAAHGPDLTWPSHSCCASRRLTCSEDRITPT